VSLEHMRRSVFLLIHFASFDMLSSLIFIVKPTRCANFLNLFWNETLHVSVNSSVHHQEFFTVHTAVVYIIQVCRQLLSRIRMEYTDPALKLSETCRVSFQNKFEKLVHLVGFIIRICHDARSSEQKKMVSNFCSGDQEHYKKLQIS
jgi:hypothetical protein